MEQSVSRRPSDPAFLSALPASMALRNLSSALSWAPEPHDDHEPPLADTSDSEVEDTSGSDSEVADDISDSEETEIEEQMEKMDQFLEKMKNAGMAINEEMARIIEEERARIREAARDHVIEAENNVQISWRRWKAPVTPTVSYLSLLTFGIASGFAGSWLGLKFCMCSALKQAIKDIVKGMFESRGRPVPEDFFPF